MSTLETTDPRALFDEHLSTLREHAGRIFLQETALSPAEEEDRESRMLELLAIGTSCGLTKREMVILLFGDVLNARARCDCTSCRGRTTHSQ